MTAPRTIATTADVSPGDSGRRALARGLAIPTAVLYAGLAAFQLALAAGIPWGEAAFGGATAVLPLELRVAAGVAVVLWTAAALVVLRRTGHRVWAPLPDQALPIALWVITGYTALGVLMNSVSPSGIERAIWVPVTIVMAGLGVTIAILLRRRRVRATSGSSA